MVVGRGPLQKCKGPLLLDSAGILSRRPPGTWYTNPRKALFFRSFCTKSIGYFSRRRPQTWCTNPRKALFFRSLCTKSAGNFNRRQHRRRRHRKNRAVLACPDGRQRLSRDTGANTGALLAGKSWAVLACPDGRQRPRGEAGANMLMPTV